MGQPCVYIVDDDANIRLSTMFLLRSHELGCHAFATGENVLAAVNFVDPGCILLDIVMPKHSGMEIEAELRRRGSTLPIVLMTGGDDEEMASRLLEMGAMAFSRNRFPRKRSRGAAARLRSSHEVL